MHVLLVEPDYYTRYPPLGLLKLSAYHKKRGDTTELVRGKVTPQREPNIIYVTSLFTYAWKPVHDAIKYYKDHYPCVKIVLGGIYATLMPDHAKLSGADEVIGGLFKEAENLKPDYDLIKKNGWNSSILFTSRGCIRKCPFCAVPLIEGELNSPRSSIKHLIENGHKKVIIWDNNFLAQKNCKKILKELHQLNLRVDFNQGLDGRLITPEIARLLSKLKFDFLRLAYDSESAGVGLKAGIDNLKRAGIQGRRIVVYTLYNYEDYPEGFFSRVRDLINWGVCSYPMRYEPLDSLEKNRHVSPNWSPEELRMVAQARRVIGYAGTFPPYEGLVKKFNKAHNFSEAFQLRDPSGENTVKVKLRCNGDLDWRERSVNRSSLHTVLEKLPSEENAKLEMIERVHLSRG